MDQRQREDRGGSNKERPRKRGASQNGSETEVRFRRWGKLLTEVRFTRWGKLLTELDLRCGENNPKKFLSSERCKIFSGQRGRNARARVAAAETPGAATTQATTTNPKLRPNATPALSKALRDLAPKHRRNRVSFRLPFREGVSITKLIRVATSRVTVRILSSRALRNSCGFECR